MRPNARPTVEELVEEIEEETDGYVMSGVEYGLMWDDIVAALEEDDYLWLAKMNACLSAERRRRDDEEHLKHVPIFDCPIPEDRAEEYSYEKFWQLSDFALRELEGIMFNVECEVDERGEEYIDAVYDLWEEIVKRKRDFWYGEE